jgi:hypothetical protein
VNGEWANAVDQNRPTADHRWLHGDSVSRDEPFEAGRKRTGGEFDVNHTTMFG